MEGREGRESCLLSSTPQLSRHKVSEVKYLSNNECSGSKTPEIKQKAAFL